MPRKPDTKVVAVASQKGGCGKTTLTVHLGVHAMLQGKRVLIVDTDPQQSASKWYDRREGEEPMLVTASLGQLKDIVEAAKEEGIEYVLVDTPPHAGVQIDQATRLADFVVIPTRPTPFDLDAVPATVEIVQAHKRPAGFVLTSTPPRSPITEEARAVLMDDYPDIPVCPANIGHRADFYNALIDGRAVNEYMPRGKATAEVTGVWKWLTKHLKGGH